MSTTFSSDFRSYQCACERLPNDILVIYSSVFSFPYISVSHRSCSKERVVGNVRVAGDRNRDSWQEAYSSLNASTIRLYSGTNRAHLRDRSYLLGTFACTFNISSNSQMRSRGRKQRLFEEQRGRRASSAFHSRSIYFWIYNSKHKCTSLLARAKFHSKKKREEFSCVNKIDTQAEKNISLRGKSSKKN